MGGALDSSRFKTYISLAIDKPQKNIDAMVIGGHGDTTMIPLHRFAKYNNDSLSNLLSPEKVNAVVQSTMVGGATLTKLLGTSAWYAPGSSIAYLVDSILNDKKQTIPCSVFLNGEYNQKDICIGVPCVIGKNGVEEIVELDLNDDEMTKFNSSAIAVKSMNSTLTDHT
jgi:malate dehydrogenase